MAADICAPKMYSTPFCALNCQRVALKGVSCNDCILSSVRLCSSLAWLKTFLLPQRNRKHSFLDANKVDIHVHIYTFNSSIIPAASLSCASIKNYRRVLKTKSCLWLCLYFVARAPVLPEISPSTFSGDLTGLLEESCLPGSTTDLEIEVSPQYSVPKPTYTQTLYRDTIPLPGYA